MDAGGVHEWLYDVLVDVEYHAIGVETLISITLVGIALHNGIFQTVQPTFRTSCPEHRA